MEIKKQIEFLETYIKKVEWTGKTASTETKKIALRRLWHGMNHVKATLESLLAKGTLEELYQWKSSEGEPVEPSKYAIQLLKDNQRLKDINKQLMLIISFFPLLKKEYDNETGRQQADGSLD